MTSWLPGILVLSVSSALGVGLALRARRGPTLPDTSETRRDDLTRQKAAAMALLREHDAAKADWEPAAWDAERVRLERAAADVLREMDGLAGAPAPQARPSVGQRHPQLVGALWGAGAVALLGAVAYGLDVDSKPREGGGMTGGTATSAPMQADAALASLRAAVDANPADIEAKNRLSHALINANQMMDAYKLTEEVVALDPQNAEARTHQAVVLLAIGDLDVAAKVLDRVLTDAPQNPEALGWRGAVHFQKGERAEAAAAWQKAVDADPDLGGQLLPLIAEAQKPAPPEGAAPAMASATGGPTAAGEAPAAAPSAQDVTGELRGALQVGDSLVIFARAEGVERGPPVWAIKATVDAVPYTFRIGPANAPMGGATPAKLVLTARVDKDGNPQQVSPGEAQGKSDPVAPGATGVVITLAP